MDQPMGEVISRKLLRVSNGNRYDFSLDTLELRIRWIFSSRNWTPGPILPVAMGLNLIGKDVD